MRDAIKAGAVRGASTIPMQVAKNLYLWNGRSYVAKALELPLAYIMSFIWSKQRMIEVYLNVAEFGRGIYGAEEASRHYFGKSAADLTRHEAVLLAVTLPSPHVRNPRKPSFRLLRIARAVELRMPIIAKRAECVMIKR
jgi:monofunctional biosynthetic peptidoglycan transglycosylase